jgi:hypothetical protein
VDGGHAVAFNRHRPDHLLPTGNITSGIMGEQPAYFTTTTFFILSNSELTEFSVYLHS